MIPVNITDNRETQARAQTNQATHVGITIILVVTAMTAASLLSKFGMIPYETLIFLSGTVGGVVNSFRRVQGLTTTNARKSSPMTERLVTIQIYVSPFVGGVFAIVLYTIFMSGFVQGSLFPEFATDIKQEYTTFKDFAAISVPKANVDVAKAIVWSFIAGFSEGLVPNFISKIAKDAGQKIKSADQTK